MSDRLKVKVISITSPEISSREATLIASLPLSQEFGNRLFNRSAAEL